MSLVVVISGLSGAGTSTALNAFGDLHYHVVDNLPVELFPQFLEFSKDKERYKRCAVLLNFENPTSISKLFADAPSFCDHRIEFLFLDASTETLLRRYSETRRPHPQASRSDVKSLSEAIDRERSDLMEFKERAHAFIDTSDLNIHELRRKIEKFSQLHDTVGRKIRLNLTSFGFKHGSPRDADLVMDVRFLPNPYFIKELKPLTGLDAEVSDFILNKPESIEFLDKFSALLNFLLPMYTYEGKSYLSVCIGCTGGRHRSVAIIEALARMVKSLPSCELCIEHRDLSRTGNP